MTGREAMSHLVWVATVVLGALHLAGVLPF